MGGLRVADWDQVLHSDMPIKRIAIEADALRQAAVYMREHSTERALIVADARTFQAAGKELAELLRSEGCIADVCMLEDREAGELPADEMAIVQLLESLAPEHETIIAVGSGTIHDIVRFVSHRTGRRFVSVPTAPSVDGFSSVGAPLIIRGFKQTVPACAPEVIFADLRVLSAAPSAMAAAGFGDMLGKYTSLADWRLGHLLYDEPYDHHAADLTEQGLTLCVDHIEEIAGQTHSGMRKLMEGLILSGIAMLHLGNSRPASGSEHHLSHFWEMQYLLEGRPALLHGAKVGAASVVMAGLYEQLGSLSIEELPRWPSRFLSMEASQAEAEAIRRVYGRIGASVLKENGLEEGEPTPKRHPILSSGRLDGEQLLRRIIEHWDEVQAIASRVPSPTHLTDLLRRVGGPVDIEQLGVTKMMLGQSLGYAMYVRSRFTVLRLYHLVKHGLVL
jgi:glycerol-1-phosphate dehydrogenase [NAD(P)+]